MYALYEHTRRHVESCMVMQSLHWGSSANLNCFAIVGNAGIRCRALLGIGERREYGNYYITWDIGLRVSGYNRN